MSSGHKRSSSRVVKNRAQPHTYSDSRTHLTNHQSQKPEAANSPSQSQNQSRVDIAPTANKHTTHNSQAQGPPRKHKCARRSTHPDKAGWLSYLGNNQSGPAGVKETNPHRDSPRAGQRRVCPRGRPGEGAHNTLENTRTQQNRPTKGGRKIPLDFFRTLIES